MNKLLLASVIIILHSFSFEINNKHTFKYKDIIANGSSQQLTPPGFPGGKAALDKYLFDNLKWPKNKNTEIQGKIVISFFVEKDGHLDGFKVEKSLSPDFDLEALRVIYNSPKWIPAMKDNKPIKSKYTMPILYQVNTDQVIGN
jgi:periplasmic protein TonB